MDANESVVRFSLIMNKMTEDECYEVIETSLEHPNLEIMQLAERPAKAVHIEIEDQDQEMQSKKS